MAQGAHRDGRCWGRMAGVSFLNAFPARGKRGKNEMGLPARQEAANEMVVRTG